MASPRVVVVGGGIAGLSVLAGLARRGVAATLLERAPVIGAHASGRNAAIHRPLEWDQTTAALVRESRMWMDAEAPDGHLRRTGLLLSAADEALLSRLKDHAQQQGVAHGERALPASSDGGVALRHLDRGEPRGGIWVDDGGVLDIHAMLLTLAARARDAGAQVRTGTGAAEVVHRSGRVTAVRTTADEWMAADHVVLAAGAWARALGAAVGCPLPLTPMRRHLVQLGASLPAAAPVVWRLDDEVYLRPEGSGVLCSPCDQTPFVDPPDDEPPADPAVLELLADKLARTAPVLAGSEVQRYWACLRTFAPDRELVAGPDPRLAGLHWLCALGGRGMSVGPGVGQWVADRLLGRKTLDLQGILAARLA